MEKLREKFHVFSMGFTSVIDLTGSTFKDNINTTYGESIASALKSDFLNVARDINKSFIKESEKLDAK